MIRKQIINLPREYKKNCKTTEKDIIKIKSLKQQGNTTKEIAKQFNLTTAGIRYILLPEAKKKEYNQKTIAWKKLNNKSKRYSPDERTDIIKRYQTVYGQDIIKKINKIRYSRLDKERSNILKKKWKKENPDKCQAIQDKYNRTHKEDKRRRSREYRRKVKLLALN